MGNNRFMGYRSQTPAALNGVSRLANQQSANRSGLTIRRSIADAVNHAALSAAESTTIAKAIPNRWSRWPLAVAFGLEIGLKGRGRHSTHRAWVCGRGCWAVSNRPTQHSMHNRQPLEFFGETSSNHEADDAHNQHNPLTKASSGDNQQARTLTAIQSAINTIGVRRNGHGCFNRSASAVDFAPDGLGPRQFRRHGVCELTPPRGLRPPPSVRCHSEPLLSPLHAEAPDSRAGDAAISAGADRAAARGGTPLPAAPRADCRAGGGGAER